MGRKLTEADYMPAEYLCRVCKHTKNIDQFHKMPNSARGHHTRCIECTRDYTAANALRNRERSAQWILDNKEKWETRSDEYKKEHLAANAKYQRDYYYANHEHCLEVRRAYQEKNRETYNANSLKYYHDHKEEISEAQSERYHRLKATDPEWYENRLRKSREYYAANREKMRAYHRQRYIDGKAALERQEAAKDDA